MKQKTVLESQRRFKMLYHKLNWINLAIPGLKLWRSDPINCFSSLQSDRQSEPIIIGVVITYTNSYRIH